MSEPVVELHSGLVRGLVEKHEDGFEYYAFKGIPYAEPPIGDLRFEDPVPIAKWSGTLDCKNYGPVCLQYDLLSNSTSFDEDCLHLNVFTRSIERSDEKKAVMVWPHMGNFTFGNASDMYYGPDYLIRKDVVLVTVNYRLSVLGFLNLEDEVAPGNQGFKDLVVALQWVQRNIGKFGGDSSNVTVGGSSAAGILAHYLAISPLAKGLLHKIICQSSVIFTCWVPVREPKKNAIKLCSLLGQDLLDSKEIKCFLKTINSEDLLEAYIRLWNVTDRRVFGPANDKASSNPFLPFDRYEAADQGVHIPCLVGHNDRDGIVLLADHITFKMMPKTEFFQVANSDFQKIMQYNAEENLDRYNLKEEQIKRLYYKSEPVSEDNTEKFVDYATDMYFHLGVHRFARVQAERSSAPTYLYRFCYDSADKLTTCYLKNPPDGLNALDEQSYFFKMRIFEKHGMNHYKKGTRSYRIMDQVTEMWTNFAKFGRPTIEKTELIPVHWKPIADGTLLRFMNIDHDLTMQYTVNLEQKLISARQIQV